MSTIFTDQRDIDGMRAAGQLAARTLEMIGQYIEPGVTTECLDQLCHEFIVRYGGTPAPLGYTAGGTLPPFPKATCISVNDVVCHGIPGKKVLKEGDILNIDVTAVVDGYHGDTSKMFYVGNVLPHAKRLCEIAQQSLYMAIVKVKPNLPINIIGQTIEPFVKSKGYSIVSEYCGHGIGTVFHDKPHILHHYVSTHDVPLQIGQCFTIEPIVNQGAKYNKTLGDKWTVKTKDRRLSAQWEHTVIVTETGCEILTLREEESLAGIYENYTCFS